MATVNLGRIKPVFKGAYAGGTAFVVDDIVTSGNETFICIQASTGNATSNATYWTKLASKGADGTNGTDLTSTLTTQGDILYRDGSGLQKLAKGTASQVLKMNSGATAPEWGTAGGGAVQQVVQKYKTDVTTQAGNGYASFHDISGMSQAITPTKASSKILVQIKLVIGNTNDYGNVQVHADIDGGGYNAIGQPDTAGSRTKGWVGNTYDPSDAAQSKNYGGSYLWTPSYSLTDVLTIKLRWSANSGTIVLNRSYAATDAATHFLGTSSITLWEIN